MGKRNCYFGLVSKLQQECFVLRIHGLHELSDSALRDGEFPSHASADVDQQADGQRRVFTGKLRNALLDSVCVK